MKCPNCGSNELSGLVEAFWVQLDKHGDALQHYGRTPDWESQSCIGEERECNDCGHRFQACEGVEDGEEGA